jgi:heme O synthase-like polyprenyltransferase
MGWASAAGTLEPGAGVLATALFSWQMPHFMALAWMCKDDYVRGGFKVRWKEVCALRGLSKLHVISMST